MAAVSRGGNQSHRPEKKTPDLQNPRPFVMRDFFFEVAKLSFFCVEVSFFPVKRGNRAGSSRNESDYSRRGTYPDQFPASRLSQLRKKSERYPDQFPASRSSQLREFSQFLKILATATNREAGNWSGYPSESRQTHSEKSRLDFLSSRGKN